MGRHILKTFLKLARALPNLLLLLPGVGWRDKLLLARCFVCIGWVETLRTGSTEALLGQLRKVSARGREPLPDATDCVIWRDQIIWAAASASLCFENAKCLTSASSAFLMLARKGIPVDLVVGVTISKSKEFASHVWLEHSGAVLHENTAVALVYRPILKVSSVQEHILKGSNYSGRGEIPSAL